MNHDFTMFDGKTMVFFNHDFTQNLPTLNPISISPFCHGHRELHKGQGKRQRQRRQRSGGEAAATLKLFKAAAMGWLSYYEPRIVYR